MTDANIIQLAEYGASESRRLRRMAELNEMLTMLREERNETIRTLARMGFGATEIAREAGVTRQTIYNIAGDLFDYDSPWHATKDGDR